MTALVHSHGLLHWAYVDSVAIAAEYRQSLTTTGILACAIAAWSAVAVANPSYAHVPPGSVRRGLPLARANVAYLACCSCLGFSVGLAPVTVVAASRSDYGGPSIVVILSGLATLIAYVAAGYLIGCLAPGYLGTPLAIGLAYSMLFFSTGLLSPIFDFDVLAGLAVPVRVSVIRIIFFGGTTIALVIAAGLWLKMRSGQNRAPAALSVTATLAPFVVVLYLSNGYSGPRVTADGAPAVCAEASDGSAVCVHPARVDLLDRLTASVSDLKRVAGPTIWPRSTVVDATVRSAAPPGSGTADLLQIQGRDGGWVAAAQFDLAAQITGAQVCGITGPMDQQAMDVSSAAAAWLLSEVGQNTDEFLNTTGAREEFEILTSKSEPDARALVARQIGAISHCAGRPF
ncbi:hypothetical protein [Nocardioides plantarum]|uniref:Uncharacterized protein n=1 Tax=Nocardioides plantarum TaxID=29299 RepID=A0ABV5KGF5_9ACTN|nr:hypothetical protein [Nocardioides plantarum]